MVKGITAFKEYFADFTDQYVLIGGGACDISFHDSELEFRATKDLDIVLVAEALTVEFGNRFWDFVKAGGYQSRSRSDGSPQFYRFEKPMDSTFPKMLELFARTETILHPEAHLTPLHIDDSVSSLSAILLNNDYYQLLLAGRDVIDGISVLRPSYLLLFKAKAWLDLTEKKAAGLLVDSRDIKKHKNDVFRIAVEMVLEEDMALPQAVRSDMQIFVARLRSEGVNPGLPLLKNVSLEDILLLLEERYCR